MTVEFLDYTEGSDRHYHDMLGYKMTEWREGYVRLEMDVQPRHRQRGSFTHGGILMGLLDIAGLLSNLYDKRDKVETLTLALSTNFRSRPLKTRGRNWRGDKSRKRSLFCKFKVIDIATDTVLATAQGTFRIRAKKNPELPSPTDP